MYQSELQQVKCNKAVATHLIEFLDKKGFTFMNVFDIETIDLNTFMFEINNASKTFSLKFS